jgi:hypothetical protein
LTRSSFDFELASVHNPLLPLPAGTSVAAETADRTDNEKGCAVDKVFQTVVPNIAPSLDATVSLATSHQVALKDCAAGDLLSIKITVPSGLETTFTYTLP